LSFWYSLALGNGAGPTSFLAKWIQSIVLGTPFRSPGQAHLW
jgi:hypothetical protein